MDCRMLIYFRFYLWWEYIFTSANKHILLSSNYIIKPIFILFSYIASIYPSVFQRLASLFTIIPISRKYPWASPNKFTAFIHSNFLTFAIYNFNFCKIKWFSYRFTSFLYFFHFHVIGLNS